MNSDIHRSIPIFFPKVLQEAVSTLKRQVEAKDTELMKARKENLTLESEAKEISQVHVYMVH